MFQNRRFVIAIFIIIIGAGASFWIVNSKSKTGSVASLFEIIRSSAEAGRFATSSDSNTQAAASAGLGQSDQTNIADRIIGRYKQEVFNANAYGAGTSSPITIPNESVLGTIIDEELAQGIAITPFKTQDIKISNDNSKDAAIAYLNDIKKAYAKNVDKFNGNGNYFGIVSDAVTSQNTGKLQEYLAATSNQITDLLAITAPSDLTSLHLGLVNAWNKRYALGKAILEGDKDVMKPVAALQELSIAINDEEKLFASFQDALKKMTS